MLPLSPPWTLHQLETAYRQGYLEALLERQPRRPGHDILAAGWEAGWRDGTERLHQQQARAGAKPRKTLRLTVQIRHSVSSKNRL
ncbi:hypothetical protein ACIPK7_20835 [Pseudomonas sp. NPDC086581]|uniref:hypothetical protein n=1 Tax=Pseudomonas sp. NPDC086581 TaxID=3364432 RepID=UPI0038103506